MAIRKSGDRFVVPIYGHRVRVFVVERGHERLEDSDARVYTYRNFLEVYFCSECLTPGLVSHEAYHVVQAVFSGIGYYERNDNEEPGAYLLQWLVNRINEYKEVREGLRRFYD